MMGQRQSGVCWVFLAGDQAQMEGLESSMLDKDTACGL